MSRRKGKTISFDAMVKFFMQNYDIPTKKDVDKLLARLDRLENLVKQSALGGNNARTHHARRRTALTAVDIVLDTIKHSRQGLGFAVIIFLAGLKQIPRMYYEAARIDGASRSDAFWHITFPLLNPSIVYLVVLQSISFLRMFAPVLAMSNQGDGGPLNSTTTVVLRVYREAFQSFNMGYAAALTVVLFGIILIVTVVQLTVTNRKID